ncbi:carbohydrate-binding family 9-like protein [Paenibacillus sp. ATY16]|uniref:carbohydrate-binding family 9-like protein n=1 Tax=Paenibacillus sp. ATY16 TaxID=1759312 RepID=UPI000E2FC663|nr:carbohydrate-binding family 9-like protein [Paenibacillus sp. ATY16]MCK9859328.1 carbohydrate-binding family 9-like protein [Paenibacillus sp. ATY16]
MMLSGVPEPVIDYGPRHYICRRATGPLALDGCLNKPFWEAADWTEDFTDIEGDVRPKPAKRTRVKMLWDDEYLYVGAELLEDQIWATLTERDSVIFYDNDFEIFIDPDGDTHGYYEIEINALNTVWDLLLVKPYRDGGPPVNGWDIAGLRSAVYIEGELNNPAAENRMWSVEIAIPWASLRECAAESRPPLTGEFWRINFSRVEWQAEPAEGGYRKVINPKIGKPYPEDNWVWSPMGIVNMHYPELWGYVVFSGEDGPHAFAMPEDERIKWELRKLYYRQRNHYAAEGRYEADAKRLMEGDGWSIEATVETTRSLFQISALSEDGMSLWCIREDGKLWKERVGP